MQRSSKPDGDFFELTSEDRVKPPTREGVIPQEHLLHVCRKGAGRDACRFVGYLPSQGDFICGKADASALDLRWAVLPDVPCFAQANNCSGPSHFRPQPHLLLDVRLQI